MATQETIKQMFSGGTLRDVEDVTARQSIAQLQSALDAMTDEDTTTAIETFQEVIDFLSGVTDDETLIGKLNELRSLINAKYTKPSGGIPASDLASGVIPDVSGKADKSEMSVGAENNGKRTVTLKQGASVDVVTLVKTVNNESILGSGNITIPAGQDGQDGADGITPHVDPTTKNWFIGTTNTGVRAEGNDGVQSGDDVFVVNNLLGIPTNLEQGQVAVLGADVGKTLGIRTRVVLDEINSDYDTDENMPTVADVGGGLTVHHAVGTNDYIYHYYVENNSVKVIASVPDPDLIYCNAESNIAVRWDIEDGWQQVDKINVVDDLLTGGPKDALSGRMGKKLADMIEDGVRIYVEGETLYIRSVMTPEIGLLPKTYEFEDTIYGNSKEAIFRVLGRKLKHEVYIDVSGVGFSGSTTIFPDAQGNVSQDVSVFFNPSENTGVESNMQGFREYTGTITVRCEGVESVSATIQGYGMADITPRVNAVLEKTLLKGVLSDTADGNYISDPATTTINIKAYNNSDVLTLSVSNNKFTLGEGQSSIQISADDAARGVDVAVNYVRQSAATAENDVADISVTNESSNELTSVQISGSTRAKITGGKNVIGTFDNVSYKYTSDGSGIMCYNGSYIGALVLPEYFYDDYGYKYIPNAVDDSVGFRDSAVTSVVASENINMIYNEAFRGCNQLKTVKFLRTQTIETRRFAFTDCSKLETFDCFMFDFRYQFTSQSNQHFYGCNKLSKVVIRSTSTFTTTSPSGLNIRDTDVFSPMGTINVEVDGVETTLTDVYYYEDENGVKHQKKLYVPSSSIESYRNNAIWSKFEIHELSELTE